MSGNLVFMRTPEAVTILMPEENLGAILKKTVSLNASDLLNLLDNPITVIPNAGDGQVAVPIRVTMVTRVHGTDGFASGGNTEIKLWGMDGEALVTLFTNDVEFDTDKLNLYKESDLTLPNDVDPAIFTESVVIAGDIEIASDPVVIDQGAIVESALNSEGFDYVAGDLVYLGDAVLRVLTATEGDGYVETYEVVTPGTNIPVDTDQETTSSGAGTGFTIDVAEIDNTKNGTIVEVTVYYVNVNTAF